MIKCHVFPEAPYEADYTVEVGGIRAVPFSGRVSAEPYNRTWPGQQRPLGQTELATYVSFEADFPVSLTVSPTRDFRRAVLRPLSKGVVPVREGGRLSFTLDRPGQYSLEIDGDSRPLFIFANAAEPGHVPAPGELYCAPGVLETGKLELTSGQRVYIAAGALIYGSFSAINAENISVEGFGIIDGSREKRRTDTLLLPYDFNAPLPADTQALRDFLRETETLCGCLHFYRCRSISVRGVTLRDSSTFAVLPAACDNVSIDNIKMAGMWRYNCDGIDFFNSADATVTNCFFRNFDDCMVIKGIKGWDDRPNENIRVSGCVIWCDWGRALEIGAETCAPEYRNIVFEDCDVIRASHIALDIQNGDRAEVHDILFRDIRVEYADYDREPEYQHEDAKPYSRGGHPYTALLMKAHSYDGPWSEDHLLGNIHDIRFSDISVLADEGVGVPPSDFCGGDAGHPTRDILIENLTFNGKKLTSLAEANVHTGNFAYNIEIR